MADMVIRFGRYGLFMWPMWLWLIWFVADMVVADMVCGQYGTDPEEGYCTVRDSGYDKCY